MKRTFASAGDPGQEMSGAPALPGDPAHARRRLLDAALDLFGTRGFSETSVRDLAVAANVNLAAVNYYFGSKENLHMEALRYGFAPSTQIAAQLAVFYDEASAEGTTEAAEKALRRYVKLFLGQVLAESHKHWNIVLREQLTPGPAFEMVMKDYLEPLGRGLSGIVGLLLSGVPEHTRGLCVRSIIGQCIHLRYAMRISHYFARQKSSGDKPPFRQASFIDESAEHIAEFSIQALRGLRSDYEKRAATAIKTRKTAAGRTATGRTAAGRTTRKRS
jgi:TetR/AcrR family transcriptional regulator, regulator of cefoperazone and chloramphenicol sensitivity